MCTSRQSNIKQKLSGSLPIRIEKKHGGEGKVSLGHVAVKAGLYLHVFYSDFYCLAV